MSIVETTTSRGISATARIEFVYFEAGGGHRSAATALRSVIEEQQRPWNVTQLNLQELFDGIDPFLQTAGIRGQDVYNKMLSKGWTLGSGYLMPVMHSVIRAYYPQQVKILADHWRKTKPDMVVSVVPNFNRAIRESLDAAQPGTPFVTILTDMADYPPHFWIERQDQYLICGSDRAVEQAREMGYPPEKVFSVSGMILRPNFYHPVTADRAEDRKKLGLDPDLPTGLVLFGGQGSKVMLSIARRLDRSGLPLQLILICGKNQKLAGQLNAGGGRMPMHVEGFTSDIPYFMHLSDFFIGKPGPGSISEALAMKLPVIVVRNSWTLPQERYNADWVLEKEVGLVLPRFSQIGKAVEKLLEPATFQRYRANAAAVQNRAIFEIPEILAKLLEQRRSA